jgi:hypothetical protein
MFFEDGGMYDLSVLRQGWDFIQKEEIPLSRAMTIQESTRQWLSLQSAFEWQLQQSAPFFEPERRAAMVELQARLRCLLD